MRWLGMAWHAVLYLSLFLSFLPSLPPSFLPFKVASLRGINTRLTPVKFGYSCAPLILIINWNSLMYLLSLLSALAAWDFCKDENQQTSDTKSQIWFWGPLVEDGCPQQSAQLSILYLIGKWILGVPSPQKRSWRPGIWSKYCVPTRYEIHGDYGNWSTAS